MTKLLYFFYFIGNFVSYKAGSLWNTARIRNKAETRFILIALCMGNKFYFDGYAII